MATSPVKGRSPVSADAAGSPDLWSHDRACIAVPGAGFPASENREIETIENAGAVNVSFMPLSENSRRSAEDQGEDAAEARSAYRELQALFPARFDVLPIDSHSRWT